MEAQYDKIDSKYVLRYLVFSQNTLIITTFLNFFTHEQLLPIVEVALASQRTEKFYKITVAKLFINYYLNRVDRSIFFLFYEDTQFTSIQNNTINSIAASNFQFLGSSFLSFQDIFTTLSQNFHFLQAKDDFKFIIQALFFDPNIPMPEMKRETIGMYCQSAFQHFLAVKRFKDEDTVNYQQAQDCLQELRQAFEIQGADSIISKEQNIKKLMETVRFRGWLIDGQCYKIYLVKGFHSHNTIVLLHALSSKLVDTFQIFLSNIQDPFMRFVQFNLRSNIYRNIILSIEERFSFVFEIYDKNYNIAFPQPPSIPKYSFWRNAFSLWTQKMSIYHEKNRTVYDYITIKLRENSLLGYLSSKIERLPSVYSELRDEAQLSGFSEVLKDQTYQETQGALELESFFEDNDEVYQVLAKDYIQYSVDMSINELTVHMCGHSQHVIASAPVFSQITSSFIQSSKEFYKSLRDKINKSIPEDIQMLTFRQLLKEDIKFVGEFIAKPLTIRQLVIIANQNIKQFALFLGEKVIIGQDMLSKYFIPPQFDEHDKILTYFAGKAGIPQNCQKSLDFFYNLQQNASAEIPKIMSEVESDYSESEHQIYDSENEKE